MTDQSPNRVPVLVVGAGPTGLAVAADLARHGISCRIVDRELAPTTLSKATSIQARTLEVFFQLGIADEAIRRGHRSHGVNISAGERRLVGFRYDDLETPYPFMLNLVQSESEQILGELVDRLGITVERGVEMTAFTQDDAGVHATLRHPDGREEALDASWIVGCDGAHSLVRHTLGIEFEGETFKQWFALADASIEWELPDDELHGFVHPNGLLFVIPLGPGKHRLILADHSHPVDAQPTLADFEAALAERCPVPARITEVGWISNFHVNVRRAAKYRVGRAFLAGEAAHVHSPAGGQGLNTSVQDAHNLTWKLALVAKGLAPDTLLDSYQPERQPVADAVLKMTGTLTRVLTLHNRLGEELRDHIMPLMTGLSPVKAQMAAQDAEIDISYRKSPIVEDHHGGHFGIGRMGSPHAGDRAPDAALAPSDDGARLFDVFRGPKQVLLCFGGQKPDASAWRRFEETAAAIDPRLRDEISVFAVAGDGVSDVPATLPVLRDETGAAHERYGAEHPCLSLIRPDGYVGFRGTASDGHRLAGYLARVFAPAAA